MAGDAEHLARALEEIAALRVENDRLRGLLGLDRPLLSQPAAGWEPTLFANAPAPTTTTKDARSPAAGTMSRSDKVRLFRSLFVGRDDVYASRWENDSGRSGWSPAVKGGWVNARKPGREYLALTDDVIESHLSGHATVGLYPLLPGDRCRLLACDFDSGSWALDALAYVEVCRERSIPAVLERSRSGDGAHVWIFFSEPVAASTARTIGAGVLRAAMEQRVEIDLGSYDRLFPAQDFMPKGSFGNLIALPLQGRSRKAGTAVFLDPATLDPIIDQWTFLASVPRMSAVAANAAAASMGPLVIGPGTRGRGPIVSDRPVPPVVRARLAGTLQLERIGLPPVIVAGLKHLASLHNPEFHERERLRLSTHATPRFVRCYREEIDLLHLPRGLQPDVEQLLTGAGSRLDLTDTRPTPDPIDMSFSGTLTAIQQRAFDATIGHDLGVIEAPPGVGKTVIACALIGHRKLPTLVLVDRKTLADQWRERLTTFLGLTKRQVGQVGGSRDRQSGVVDIATLQTLARHDDPASFIARYGMVVVDECHHVPAISFEKVVRDAPVRYWIGLTATPYRRDQLEGIITMHLGPVRHRIVHAQTESASMPRRLIVHDTLHDPGEGDPTIQQVFRGLVDDNERTTEICADVADALTRGRRCIVLTQWTDHVTTIATQLAAAGHEPVVMTGEMGKKARTAALARLHANIAARTPVVLVATGSLLGEGFDVPALDTLFLAFPVSFKGRIVHYVGRVLRTHDDKTDLEVHDYVDSLAAVLKAMHAKRLPSYATLGFDTKQRGR